VDHKVDRKWIKWIASGSSGSYDPPYDPLFFVIYQL